jgi:hypothetical protein
MGGGEVKPIEASVNPDKGVLRAVTGGNLALDARSLEGSSVMSELDVIVIHIRAGQAAEYERLFAERELPRWREYKARGAFLSARISRVAFGTDDRNDVAKYVIAVEVPGHAAHSEHDADPGFQEFNRLADLLQPEDPLVYGGEVLHAV